jgi:LPS-assembly lipoprotein
LSSRKGVRAIFRKRHAGASELRRKIALTPFLLLVAGCGFRLRGTAELPFEALYVPGATAGMALELKRNLEAGSRARVVDDPKLADAVIQFTEEAKQKEILSLTGTGRVREFQLRYRVGWRVHDGKGGEYVPQNTIQLTRDVTFNDAEILAKEQEEQLLFRDMQNDMVQQIMRRLAAAKRP